MTLVDALTLIDTVPEVDTDSDGDGELEEHSEGVRLGLPLLLRLTDCVPEMHPEAVGEALAHCEALTLGDTEPDPQEDAEALCDSEADPHDVPDTDTLLLGEMVPLTVVQMVGEAEPETVVDRELHPDALTDTVPLPLPDTLALELTEGDSEPLTVGVRDPVEHGVADCEALVEADSECDTDEHPEAVGD